MSISRLFAASLVTVVVALTGCGGEQGGPGGAKAAVSRGQAMYSQCRACHTLKDGEPHKIGPNLHGIFGARAGVAPGFAYSEVFVKSDIVWSTDNMNAWLAQPAKFLPGNRMIFAGIKDDANRVSLVEYLQAETGLTDPPASP